MNQKTATVLGPEIVRLTTSETKKFLKILILGTNHQLYLVLDIRISFVWQILKS